MITPEQLNAIGEFAAGQTLSESTVADLRSQFPDLHFTYCMDDDVSSARPVYEHALFNLYLIDGRDHCLAFTQDPEIATGVVVAELEEE